MYTAKKKIGWPADDRRALHNCHRRNFSFFETRPPYQKEIKLLQTLSKPKVGYLLEELPGPESMNTVKTTAKLGVTGIAESGIGKRKLRRKFTLNAGICLMNILSFRKRTRTC